MKTWVKLYTEIINDPDQGTLTWAQRGIWSALLALAGQLDHRDDENRETGRLDTPDRVAWHLRCADDELADALTAFGERGMIEEREGVLYLPNYAKRQARPPSARRNAVAERVRQHRAKTAGVCNDDVTSLHTECNDDVTTAKRGVTASESESDTESEAEADAEAPAGRGNGDSTSAELFQMVESAGILVNRTMAEQYLDILDDDAQGDLRLIRACFQEAASTGARPMPKWLQTVVRRCRRDGCMPGQWPGDGATTGPDPPGSANHAYYPDAGQTGTYYPNTPEARARELEIHRRKMAARKADHASPNGADP